MARRSLKPQLNQIRAWVRQGRTDAWIAHQLEVSASELREFRKQHGFTPDEEDAASGEVDLRDEIEAEIEAAAAEEPEEEEPEAEAEATRRRGRRSRRALRRGGRRPPETPASPRSPRRTRAPQRLEASFDHGETDGYGLWLDPRSRTTPSTPSMGGQARGDGADRRRSDRDSAGWLT